MAVCPANPRIRPLRSRAAFTLIELLVVIAIISMLISMLTPSLSRARAQAKATVCLSTLSEMMKGLVAYGNDYAFALPPSKYAVKDQPGVYHGWSEALYRTLYDDDDFSMSESFPVMRNLEDRFGLWVCKETQQLSDSSGHYRVYEYAWSRGSLDKIKHRIPIIIDANPQVTDPEDLLRSDIPKLRIAGLEGEAYIDERHYGGANFSFNDGHASRSTDLKEKLAVDWDLDPDTPNQ